MSRQTDYTDELADLICERLSNGESLRSICRDETMPGRTTVLDWMEANELFRAKCARARERQAECMVDMQLDEAAACTEANAAAARVKISAYQWIASKLAQKKFGERLDMTHASPDGGPVAVTTTVEVIDAAEAARRYRELMDTPG